MFLPYCRWSSVYGKFYFIFGAALIIIIFLNDVYQSIRKINSWLTPGNSRIFILACTNLLAFCFVYIIESQCHTMSGIGRDLTRSSNPIPLILEYICVVLIVDNYIYLSTTYLFFFLSFFNELSLTCILKSKFILLHFVKKCWRLKAAFEWKHKKSVKEKFISF